MKFNLAKKRILNFEEQRNKLLLLSGSLLIVVFLQTICLLFRNEKVIVLPPEVKREFWAKGNRFSPEYLEEQAVYMIHLALDVNQVSYPYNTEILMRYADVNTCSYLREKFEKHYKTLRSNDASTRFDVKDVTVYPEKNKVHITGVMNNFVGSKPISSKQETYEVEFKIFRGRLFLKDIKLAEGGGQ
jgi:conjugal transfer pilus assembly protein TraE